MLGLWSVRSKDESETGGGGGKEGPGRGMSGREGGRGGVSFCWADGGGKGVGAGVLHKMLGMWSGLKADHIDFTGNFILTSRGTSY